mgnify:FL=1
MNRLIYLGDEASAAGFRLAGVDARAVTPGQEAAEFAQACSEASVLLLGEHCAARLPTKMLDAALAAAQPLLLVLDDRDLAEPIRRLLGVMA